MKIKKYIRNLLSNDYIYSIFSKIICVILGLAYTILYSRYLGAELRGETAVIVNAVSIFSTVMSLGMYHAYPIFRNKNISISIYDFYVSYINKMMGMAFLYVLVCFSIAILFPLDVKVKVILVILPISILSSQLNYALLIEYPRIEKNSIILKNVIDLVLVIMCFSKQADLMVCVTLLISKELAYLILTLSKMQISIAVIRPTLRGVLGYIQYGVIPMITLVLMNLNYRVDILMLNQKVPNGDIGIYSLGVQVAERLWLIPESLRDILLSKLSKGKGPNEVARVVRISIVVMFVAMLMMIIFGQSFIVIFFGEEYKDAYQIMLIILASIWFMVFYKLIYAFNVANGYRLVNLAIFGISSIINIVLNYVWIPIYGIKGAAYASLISYTICGLGYLCFFLKTTHMKISEMLFMNKEDIKLLMKITMKN